jgi:hypothetical protein
MKEDPFGNLMDWGNVLDILDDLAENGQLSQCQKGLARVLRYKGNWRLREEVLKCVGHVQHPSAELVHQVISILDDDNIYYEVRIIAGNALIQLLNNPENSTDHELYRGAWKVVEKLISTPQPPFFEKTIKSLYSELTAANLLET